MDIEQFRDYCLSLEGVSEKMPFQGFFRNSKSILVFYVNSKMFCLFDIDSFESITIKCNSSKIEDLKEKYNAVGKPFNLNPKHWISVRLNEDLSDARIKLMVKNSYNLVFSPLTEQNP